MNPYENDDRTDAERHEYAMAQAYADLEARLASVRGLLDAVTAERDLLASTLADFREHLADESDITWSGAPNEAMRLATRLEHSHARASKSLDELSVTRALLSDLRKLAEKATRAPTDAERLLAASIVCARLVRGREGSHEIVNPDGRGFCRCAVCVEAKWRQDDYANDDACERETE